MNETSEGGWSVLVGASNEEDLIAKSRTGDSTSFVGLVQTHDAYLRRVVFNLLGDAETMDEVLLNTYLATFDDLQDNRDQDNHDDAPFGDWLFRQVFAACERTRTDKSNTENETQKQLDIMPAEEVAALSMVAAESVSSKRAAQLFDVTAKEMKATIASARAVLGEDDEAADLTVVEHRTPRHGQDFWTTINRSFPAAESANGQSEAAEAANTSVGDQAGVRRWLGRTTTMLAVTTAGLVLVVAAAVTMLGRA